MTSEEYSLVNGMKYINSLKPAKTQLFCERILAGMCESKTHLTIFTEEEIIQLCTMFGLEKSALLLTIDCLIYIYRQCAFIRIPKKIQPFFVEIGLDEVHMEGVMMAWKSYSAQYMALIKEKTNGLTIENKLESFDWKLQMPMAKSEVEPSKFGGILPNARAAIANLEFGVKGEKVKIELNKTQLQGMYEELEKIQFKLDELTK